MRNNAHLAQLESCMKFVAALIGALAVAGGASAQENEWRVTMGAGGIFAPAYEGDDDYRLSLVPNIEVRYGERFTASVQNGARYRVVDAPVWRLGPIARIKFSRDEDGAQAFAVSGEDSDDLRGLGDVDASLELGVFADYVLGAVTLSAEARQAVSGHESWVADLGASWSGRSRAFSRDIMWSAGPRVRLVGDGYNEAYFGVTASQAVASGLPLYEAAGGLYSYGFGASAVAPLSSDGRWALVGLASYDRLTGDAGDSPLVRERGSADQATLGLVLSRRL
jgi:outer membrane protein